MQTRMEEWQSWYRQAFGMKMSINKQMVCSVANHSRAFWINKKIVVRSKWNAKIPFAENVGIIKTKLY